MNVAILGFGVVGSGVAQLIKKNADIIKKNSNVDLTVSRILDIRDFPDNEFAELLTKKFDDILLDDSIEVVVETMGGTQPAFNFVSACLKSGKHVCSSNKELVAKKGYELLNIAKENNVNFLFEASVGGGIPIIRPISRCLAANRITEVAGILNGTTNFILNKMIDDKMDFDSALKLAQEKGYAEKDPAADIEGIDACRKICILASLVFGFHVYPNGVYTEGITKITLNDVEAADSLGYCLKLIASAKRYESGKIDIKVTPALIKKGSVLSNVNGVFNACLIRGDAVGDVVMYGQGAGSLATASAVVGDIIDCASNNEQRKFFGWGEPLEDMLLDHESIPESYFVRIKADDNGMIKNTVCNLFPFSHIQHKNGELSFIANNISLKELNELLQKIELIAITKILVAEY